MRGLKQPRGPLNIYQGNINMRRSFFRERHPGDPNRREFNDNNDKGEFEDQEFEHEEIQHLEKPIEKILEQLRYNIDRGAYQLIVGDDASGRVPTLIFSRLLRNLNRLGNYPVPKTIFLAGSGQHSDLKIEREKVSRIKEYLKQKYSELISTITQKEAKKRALVVTEMISSGDGLKPITQALKELGIKFDIASIAVIDREYHSDLDLEDKLGGKIVYGQTETPAIFGDEHFSGVVKSPDDLFAESLSKYNGSPETNEFLRTVRNDVQQLSKVLEKKYIDQGKKSK